MKKTRFPFGGGWGEGQRSSAPAVARSRLKSLGRNDMRNIDLKTVVQGNL